MNDLCCVPGVAAFAVAVFGTAGTVALGPGLGLDLGKPMFSQKLAGDQIPWLLLLTDKLSGASDALAEIFPYCYLVNLYNKYNKS